MDYDIFENDHLKYVNMIMRQWEMLVSYDVIAPNVEGLVHQAGLVMRLLIHDQTVVFSDTRYQVPLDLLYVTCGIPENRDNGQYSPPV